MISGLKCLQCVHSLLTCWTHTHTSLFIQKMRMGQTSYTCLDLWSKKKRPASLPSLSIPSVTHKRWTVRKSVSFLHWNCQDWTGEYPWQQCNQTRHDPLCASWWECVWRWHLRSVISRGSDTGPPWTLLEWRNVRLEYCSATQTPGRWSWPSLWETQGFLKRNKPNKARQMRYTINSQ